MRLQSFSMLGTSGLSMLVATTMKSRSPVEGSVVVQPCCNKQKSLAQATPAALKDPHTILMNSSSWQGTCCRHVIVIGGGGGDDDDYGVPSTCLCCRRVLWCWYYTILLMTPFVRIISPVNLHICIDPADWIRGWTEMTDMRRLTDEGLPTSKRGE